MKIAIAELETQTKINDIDCITAGAIVGGGTSGATTVEVTATGEQTYTDAQTFAFTVGFPLGDGKKGSLTFTGGLGVAADFPLKFTTS
jgi:hypothetical protein